MPRNNQGLYTPPLPPVLPGELIESAWANTTVDDIGAALTGSLPRDGSAPMVGPLILRNAPPSQPREAVSKQYLEQFLAYATGMPVGAVFAFASATTPTGYLLCNGQAVSRTVYAALFAAIGTTFGAGDSSTTFNVPDMRNWFVRGRSDSRTLGSTQTSDFASHAHPLQDPGHAHAQVAHDHTITTGGHNHSVNDPGHAHTQTYGTHGVSGTSGAGLAAPAYPSTQTTIAGNSAVTAVSLQPVGSLGGSADSRQPVIESAVTGATVGAAGGIETRPQNIALDYYIKAIDDATQLTAVTGITSSDDNMISINSTNPVVPELDIQSNVAFGTVKLDANAKISPAQLPAGVQSFLGTFDASSGQNPSQEFPSTTFNDGDTYLLSDGGTITVFNPNTNAAAPTMVEIGWNLVYLNNGSQPVGWYFIEAAVVTAAIASQVAFTPSGTISAINVQTAIEELDSETQSGLESLNTSKASIGNAAPTMNGVATPGVSSAASRQDHVHPTDTSRAPSSAATAAGTSFVPGGTISAATVQGALVELDNEKVALDAFIGLNQSLVGNGFQKLPGGLIVQWGAVDLNANGAQTDIPLNTPWPTGFLAASITLFGYPATGSVSIAPATGLPLTYLFGYNSNPAVRAAYWIALGH